MVDHCFEEIPRAASVKGRKRERLSQPQPIERRRRGFVARVVDLIHGDDDGLARSAQLRSDHGVILERT
jgi:hypothetical protein